MPERFQILRHRAAARLHEIRIARGLSQRALALAAGVDAAQISRWENGAADFSFAQAILICERLQIWTVDFLVPAGSPIPPRRSRIKIATAFNSRKDYGWDDPLDHLAAMWDELRAEIRESRDVDIGRQPADDWIEAIRERMGICHCAPAERQRRHDRIARRLYHAAGLK